jgi:hypothetical protein
MSPGGGGGGEMKRRSKKTKKDNGDIGANGTISKSFGKYLSNKPGKHEIKDLQKTAI